jgi:plasmid stabilization system protein ParE
VFHGRKPNAEFEAAMPAELIISAEAVDDLVQAYDWYETQRVGLGEEFLNCIDASIESIRRFPELCAIAYENYRRALVRRFPFAIFYEHSENVVSIYCVFHTSRDPNKWRARLP